MTKVEICKQRQMEMEMSQHISMTKKETAQKK